MPPASRDGIAVVTIDNPPVNALGPAAIGPLMSALDAAYADPAVHAIVLTGAGEIFSGGADMRAFSVAPAGPTTRDLIAHIEGGVKPVVAAIDGDALGGGFELALGCDLRVASSRARVGFPEMLRGLLPGAGGTQRTPRLTSVRSALDLILSGTPIGAARAHELGLIDIVAEGDLLAGAIAAARGLGSERRRASDRVPVVDADGAVEAALANAAPEERGGLAARRAIACVADALTLPFAQGMVRERERFVELLGSEQAKARIHVFFAEREAAKPPAGALAPGFAIRSAAIVGAGTMGSGIAMACADAGIDVVLIDLMPAALERAAATIAANYASAERKGRLTREQAGQRAARIRRAGTLEAAGEADLVLEAVFEEMPVKQDVFGKLDAIARPGALLATNTSSLDVDAIAAVTSRPQDCIGLHFFSPANVMKLLEIVRGARTSPETLAKSLAIAKQVRKVAVVSGNCDGFIGNRMLAKYRREAEYLLEEGASPQQIDTALRGFGLAMGPFAMSDLAGLDIGWRIRQRRNAANPPAGRYSTIADTLCEMGRFGQKTGAGYYRYEAGSRTPVPDPVVDEVIANAARAGGIGRRTVSDEEIVARCLLPLVNEGALIVGEGIAARPGDVDVVYVNGYGFPAWRGGPMRWADSLGLRSVLDDVLAFERERPADWVPAPLLRALAEGGGSFGAWTREGSAAHA